MEIESGRNAHRVVEEAAVVGDGRLVVDLLGGCVKGAAGIESGAIDVPEGEHVLADVEFVEQTDTPAAYRQGEAPAFGRFPALFGAAVALQALQVTQPGIEGVGSFVAVADVGIEQDVVHDPFVQLRIVGFGVVEQGHDIAAVPMASLVFAAREDAELLARLVRAHSLPVDGELDEGARLGFIVGGQALDAIIIERVGTAQEERIVSGQQQGARENTGYGLCRLRVELVVDLGVHFTQELVFLVAEVLQQIDGYHQPVLFGPDNTRFRGQAHTEERVRIVDVAVRVFAVVEPGVEVGSDENLLGRGAGGSQQKCQDKCDLLHRRS